MKEKKTGNRSILVAIDGPAASGKSTVARVLAERVRFANINSGLMYRAATRSVLEEGIDPSDTAAVAEYFRHARVGCDGAGEALSVVINGKARHGLADADVNAHVSSVASVPEVRHLMVAIQREMAADRPTVMEGRDIGSVVFPDTPYKFYIDASEEVRARRRAAQGSSDAVGERDKADSTRKSSPLVIPDDATVIDSSDLSVDEVVDRIVVVLEESGDPEERDSRGR